MDDAGGMSVLVRRVREIEGPAERVRNVRRQPRVERFSAQYERLNLGRLLRFLSPLSCPSPEFEMQAEYSSEFGHPIQCKPATQSRAFRPPLAGGEAGKSTDYALPCQAVNTQALFLQINRFIAHA